MMSFLMHHRMKFNCATVVVRPLKSTRSVLQNGSNSFFEYPTRLDLYATCTGKLPFVVLYTKLLDLAYIVMNHSRLRKDIPDRCVSISESFLKFSSSSKNSVSDCNRISDLVIPLPKTIYQISKRFTLVTCRTALYP